MQSPQKSKYMKQYNFKHREETKNYQKSYKESHREELKNYQKSYNFFHKEELINYKKIHKEELKNYQKLYDYLHRDKKKKYQKMYMLKHKEEYRTYNELWNLSHKDYQKNYKKSYNPTHKEKRTKYHKTKLQTNIGYKIKNYLGTRLYHALKGSPKLNTTMNLIGCSIDHLKSHLETQFKPEMSWNNYGKWHIDHIRPCASFDLTKPEAQKQCFHYTNLQPLWAKDNLIKGKKLKVLE